MCYVPPPVPPAPAVPVDPLSIEAIDEELRRLRADGSQAARQRIDELLLLRCDAQRAAEA